MSLKQVYDRLYKHYGPQHWWPGDTPFEVMVGAVLTQNTAWTNVEKAIYNLKLYDALSPHAIVEVPHEQLAQWIRPSGYFNIKARRLRNFCQWYIEQGEYPQLSQWETNELREGLLSVNGVGPETADDIMLYAFARPVFVIDAYTRRIFSRLDYITGDEGYEELREFFEKGLARNRDKVQLFNEYHALIVMHAKDICKMKPSCDDCCLKKVCLYLE
ncbi:MAG: endonuclease III domain-containing protein [Gammaproteobacteria bacterium]|nr:endonuclease III domain-containing protein [Gammaproteobacteria bacterium]